MNSLFCLALLSMQHNTHSLHITQPQCEKNRYYTEREFEKQNYFYSLRILLTPDRAQNDGKATHR